MKFSIKYLGICVRKNPYEYHNDFTLDVLVTADSTAKDIKHSLFNKLYPVTFLREWFGSRSYYMQACTDSLTRLSVFENPHKLFDPRIAKLVERSPVELPPFYAHFRIRLRA